MILVIRSGLDRPVILGEGHTHIVYKRPTCGPPEVENRESLASATKGFNVETISTAIKNEIDEARRI